MLKSLDALEQGFRDLFDQSTKLCGVKLEEMRTLTITCSSFYGSYLETNKETARKINGHGHTLERLEHAYLLELFRTSGRVLFLTSHALYRNTFDEIRHALESIVQAIYIDEKHPETPFSVKMEILKEVEYRREYHAIRLIDEIKISQRDKLKAEYKELSKVVHPSHKEIAALVQDVLTDTGVPSKVGCDEVSRICESLRKMYDISFYLIITSSPSLKQLLEKDSSFLDCVKLLKFDLLAGLFKIRTERISSS
jgi:hypothetical protein